MFYLYTHKFRENITVIAFGSFTLAPSAMQLLPFIQCTAGVVLFSLSLSRRACDRPYIHAYVLFVCMCLHIAYIYLCWSGRGSDIVSAFMTSRSNCVLTTPFELSATSRQRALLRTTSLHSNELSDSFAIITVFLLHMNSAQFAPPPPCPSLVCCC